MNPITIELMLHIYYDSQPHPKMRSDSFKDAARNLVSRNLVKFDAEDDSFTSTSRGDAWVRMLLATPLPEQVWMDPRNQEMP